MADVILGEPVMAVFLAKRIEMTQNAAYVPPTLTRTIRRLGIVWYALYWDRADTQLLLELAPNGEFRLQSFPQRAQCLHRTAAALGHALTRLDLYINLPRPYVTGAAERWPRYRHDVLHEALRLVLFRGLYDTAR